MLVGCLAGCGLFNSVLEAGRRSAAAELVAKLEAKAEIARELAYRLYTLRERKKRALSRIVGLTAIQEYGYAACMKATIEIPDELYRRVKAKSALEGRPVRAVAVELLRTWVGDPLEQAAIQAPSLHDRMQNYCGIVDSGVRDLATNPEYLADFGRDSTGHR